ncbi:MAG: TIM-barrel domain-containing protein, partial [Rudaea sp.]
EGREARDHTDLYFFGYGHDYPACLRDFVRVAGRVPLPPRWMLGNWWSRYWAYSQQELLGLMEEFRRRDIPLSVCIVDMDWHITETGNRCTGWTGYTWNRVLFPDPEAFLKDLHEMGLHVALNLHPAEGVHPHEQQYPDMAVALGIDPSSGRFVEFDLADHKFARAYFEILHHPYEELGVDFWWLDWQQGTRSKMEDLDPLPWLNHLHFADLGRDGTRRPVIFSRYGGLGSHRYPVGFSGDTLVTWNSLAFQPYFTATAANVGYGWWSHDIGGHWKGIEDPELYARWVQFGVFSPILRLHSTKNPYHERRPWGWGEDVLRVTRAAMRLRHSLIPYIYTMAWRNTACGLPLITPMYYEYPEMEAAYLCPAQYFFGSELIAAPFVAPRDPETRLCRQSVWLPEGDWFGFFNGEHFSGGRWHAIYGGMDDIPVIAEAGAIVPLGPEAASSGTGNPGELAVHIFAGASNKFELYEDDGETTGYERGRFALTPIFVEWKTKEMKVRIAPVRGDVSPVPASRGYRFVLHGIRNPERMQLAIAGEPQEVGGHYDEESESLAIGQVVLRTQDELELIVSTSAPDLMSRRDRRIDKCRNMLRAFRMDTTVKLRIDKDLDRILERPNLLESYPEGMHDSQRAALRSVVESRREERE